MRRLVIRLVFGGCVPIQVGCFGSVGLLLLHVSDSMLPAQVAELAFEHPVGDLHKRLIVPSAVIDSLVSSHVGADDQRGRVFPYAQVDDGARSFEHVVMYAPAPFVAQRLDSAAGFQSVPILVQSAFQVRQPLVVVLVD